MKFLINFFIVLIFFNLCFIKLYSQAPFQFDCGYIPDTTTVNYSTNPFQGFIRPNRTDSINGVALPSTAYFPVLMVFVQFQNEPDDPRNSWPQDSSPAYLSNLISIEKRTSVVVAESLPICIFLTW